MKLLYKTVFCLSRTNNNTVSELILFNAYLHDKHLIKFARKKITFGIVFTN